MLFTMEPWQWGLLLKPFGAMLLLGLALSIRYLIHHKMPEGKWKNIILKRRFGTHKDAFMR